MRGQCTRSVILCGLFAVSLLLPNTASAQSSDLSGLKFCIDPGHGGHNAANDRHVIPDVGTDFWESESNFQKAKRLDTLLTERGAWVILTRYTNDYPADDEPLLTARWELANANNITNRNLIRVGQQLIIPGITQQEAVAARGIRHTVKSGESLSTIAQQYDVTVEVIMAFNGIDDPNTIIVGQELIVPQE